MTDIDKNNLDSEHLPSGVNDEELLLPWYANSRLEDVDRDKIEQAIATNDSLKSQLDEILYDRTAAGLAYEMTKKPSDEAWHHLVERINAADSTSQAQHNNLSGLRERFSQIANWLSSLSPQNLGAAALAAILILFIQSGIIATLLTSEPKIYTTASGTTDEQALPHSKQLALVSFNSNIPLSDITTFLDHNNLQLVSGPKDGFYTLSIEDANLSLDQVDAYISNLADDNEIIAFIGRKTD